MKDPVQEYFQAGAMQRMIHPPVNYPILDSIRTICCDEYFSVLEMTHIEDQEIKDKVRDMLTQDHMKMCYGAQLRLLGSKLNPNDLNEEGRKEAEAVLIDSIDEAQYMGTKGIALLAEKWESETRDQAHAQLLKITRAVCGYTVSKGMMVELEVFDFDMDKAAFIGLAPYAAKFAADIRTTCNNFDLLVDLSYSPITYEISRFVIQTPRSYITHLHISNAVVKEDFETYSDQHLRFGFPGSANDTEQLMDFFTALKEEGFFNKDNPYILPLEAKPWADEDEDIILANIKRIINKAWALVED